MKIITANLNGIRSAERKGFFPWAQAQEADVICVQEVRAQAHQLEGEKYQLQGYKRYLFDAEKKGYSGVGLYCKQEPQLIVRGLGWDCADKEARYLHADFGNLIVASLYLPSGSSGEARQAIKYEFLDQFVPYLEAIQQSNKPYILCGDLNIVHQQRDIKNWKANQKSSGCLPEERAWLDRLFGELGYIDAFREVDQRDGQYTWWSNRGRAYANNVGWRIDYQVVTPHFKGKIESAQIYKAQKFSDHAPLIIQYA